MIRIDGATIAFTFGIAVLAAVLVSLLPAAQASMLRPIDALKAGAKGLTPRGVRHLNGRGLLVTTQVALALLLLCGAGLMIRSAAGLQATDIGVNTRGVLTARLELPRASYPSEKGTLFYGQLLEGIRALPGVESVALANCPPVSGGCNGTSFWDPARGRKGPGRDPLVGIHWASPGYFETLGIRLQRGRLFTDGDRAGVPHVVLVSETAARELWPGDDPIGKRAALGQGGLHEGAVVVGVVSDVKYQSLDTAARRDFYVPVWQSYQPRLRLFVRGASDPAALVSPIRAEVQALDPALPISEIKTLDDRVDDAMWRTRVLAWILSAFAAIALLLTGIGVFGVMAQTVVQRTSEIGIRLALGAARRDVLLLVLRQAAVLTGLGLAIGLGSAFALSRVLQSLLYGVAARDPLTFAVVGVVIGAVALVACYLPARQACRVDAIVALRTE
jgi:predicted permease